MPLNSTAWVSEPDGRGTWGIIQTCMTTLFLCVYTAIHLNIRPHQSKIKSFLKQVRYAAVASILPEFMIVNALYQWGLARNLQFQLNHLDDSLEECEHCTTRQGVVNTPREPSLKTVPTDEASNAGRNGTNDFKTTVLRTIRKTGTLNVLESGLRRTSLGSRADSNSGQRKMSGSVTNQVSSTKVEAKCSLRQAFFIIMGGVAIETKSISSQPYLTLTASGALELAKFGLLSPPPEDVIDDKTRADPITKVVVCVQAGWFIVQCIARAAQHLPLTLLEVHVLAHVVVALIMYLIWFCKPYNVSNPLVLDGPEVQEAGAFFLLHRQPASIDAVLDKDVLEQERRNGWDTKAEERPSRCIMQSDIDLLKAIEAREIGCSQYDNDSDDGSDRASMESHIDDLPTMPTPANHADCQEADIDVISSGPTSGEHRHSDEGPASVSPSQSKERGEVHPTNSVDDISDEHIPRCWRQTPSAFEKAVHQQKLAERCLQRLRSQSSHFPYFIFSNGGVEFNEICLVDYISEYIKNPAGRLLQRRTGSDRTPKRIRYSLMPSAPYSNLLQVLIFCYSAFHLSAWNAHFPTVVERWMWRGSGLTLMAYPLVWLPFVPLMDNWWKITETDISGYGDAYMRLAERSRVKFVALSIILLIPISLATIWYIIGTIHFLIFMPAARLYLLVEAFASFRDPESRVYDTVQWTNFWPHG